MEKSDVRHEPSDVIVQPVVLFGVGLIVIALVIYGAMAWMFDLFAAREARLKPPPSQLARSERPREPPEPRLQTAPTGDLSRSRAREDALLQSYDWIDREAGVVRIPIERAMELLLERGLPTRSEEPEKIED